MFAMNFRLRSPVAIGLLWLVWLSCSPVAWSQETEPPVSDNVAAEPLPDPEEIRRQERLTRLNNLERTITERQKQLRDLQRKLRNTKDELERSALTEQIQENEKALRASRSSFESIATGGVDLASFADVPNEKFDWRGELLEILKPLFQGLKDFTETPRMLERLRSSINFYEQQLEEIEAALERIDQLERKALDKATNRRVDAIREDWEQRRNDAQRDLEVAQVQLQNLQERQGSFWQNAGDALQEFVTGRGLNLLLAMGAAILVWLGMQALLRLLMQRENLDEARIRSQSSRILIYVYRLLTVLAALISFLAVLYVTGDWLLLGLALLVLAGTAIGLKNYLSRFLAEARLILNLGAVREGERVVYQGIPWRVRSINVYSQLVNPAIQGGPLRLPLSEMAGLISRPYSDAEVWFPSRVDDYVLLSDGTFGQVVAQTPEVVQLLALGSVRTFSTSAYLGLSPRNLSSGQFGVSQTFGVDYALQAICLTEIPAALKAAIEAEFAKSELAPQVEDVLVDFSAAGASSLDYLVYVTMNSAAASSYWKVGRMAQQACVRACSERGWGIPFPQLTVHMAEAAAT
jgi:small-conductance mechanosensitive channel